MSHVVAAFITLVVSAVPAPSAAAQTPEPATGAPVVGDDGPVTPVDLSEIRANNSATVAVDATRPGVVAMAARIDHPVFGCTLHISRDGGRGWVPVVPVPDLPEGAERCYGPEIGFDSEGRLYFLFVGLQGRGNTPMGVFLTTSGDLGRSFDEPRRLLGPNSFQVRMAVDPRPNSATRLHVVWVAAGAEPTLGGFPTVANPIMAMHSDNGGKTFTAPVQVSDPTRARVVAPAIAVSPDHSVYVTYYDLREDAVDYQGLEGPTWAENWSLVVTGSDDGGRSFSPGVIVDDGVVPPERVMLIFTMPPPTVAALGGGRVLVGWHDARNTDWDAFVRRSGDAGRSWGDLQRLNDDPVGNRRHQSQPRLSVAPGGRVDAVFYDRRDDPENLASHVSYTYSDDGGASFKPNLKLTGLPSRTTVGPRYPIPSAAGLVEFGSRLGVASTDAAAVAGWTDTRNSRPGQQQDIFANEVRFGPRPAGDADGRSAGGGDDGDGRLWVILPVSALAVAVAMAVSRRRQGPVTAAEVPE